MDKFYYCHYLNGFYLKFIILLGLINSARSKMNITELNMPESIKLGTTNEIIFDCDFRADETEEDLVIKWFYNGERTIYQWIPDYKKHGSPSEIWKQRLESSFNYTKDGNTDMVMELKISNITMDLSGNYTCQVSSMNGEVSETKQLIIYSPAQSELDIMLFESESLVMCTVHGISPEPKMDFYIRAENGTGMDISEEVETVSDDDGFYNVTAKHHFQNATLPQVTTFVCNLSIPGTDYVLTKTWELRNELSKKTVKEEIFNFLTTTESDEDEEDETTEGVFLLTNQDSSGALLMALSSCNAVFAVVAAIVFLFN